MALSCKVWKEKSDHDTYFKWKLAIKGITANCSDLKWEQFVSGGFTLTLSDGSIDRVSALLTVKKINPAARTFTDDWIDDLLKGMLPGPKTIRSYQYAQCKSGRSNKSKKTASLTASRGVVGSTYYFEDEPGFDYNFFDDKTLHKYKGKKVAIKGITWYTSFSHKLWLNSKQLCEVLFDLKGEHYARVVRLGKKSEMYKMDLRRIENLKMRVFGVQRDILEIKRMKGDRGIPQPPVPNGFTPAQP